MASMYVFILIAAKYISCYVEPHDSHCHTEVHHHIFIIFLIFLPIYIIAGLLYHCFIS